MPAQSATLRDVLAAADDALIAGDAHRARRLLALARELEQLGVGRPSRETKGGDHGR